MESKLSLTMYDTALINIIQGAEIGVLRIASEEFKIPYAQLPIDKPGLQHKRLSQSWVKYLAHSLEGYFREEFHSNNIFAFPPNKNIPKRPEIGRQEFLYDISIGEYYSLKSSINQRTIKFQAQPIWQIESEFSNNMREIAIDFSKLIAGNATFKMMVGPAGDTDVTPYLTDMAQLAVHCYSELYFLFLNHPSNWYHDDKLVILWQLYKWNDPRWYQIGAT